ncbi:MFS transporter [Hydrogenophaga sp. RWCD_12]|uniref:MFS transporter n=1 Tax=Hydrogenophaga sp. RWCD_12 TaxID=3391190 RepID=UPI0039855803
MKQTESPAPVKAQEGITITLALSMLLASLSTSIANIALPTMAEAFAAPFAQVQSVVVAYLVALTITVVAAGRLGDSLGLKRSLMLGLAVFAVASLLCGAASNLWLLVSARALQGIGAAFLMTLSMALMRQTARTERLGRAMGLLGTVSALGTALGPSLGGVLIEATGWRGIFWVQFPLACIAFFLAFVTLSSEPTNRTGSNASLLSALDRDLARSLLVNLLVATIMMTTLVVGPFYLGFGLGLKASQIGFVMAIGPVISIFGGIPSGRLVDAWGSGRILAIGLNLLAVGTLLLAFLPNMIGVIGYVLSISVLTPGYQLFQAANNTAALAKVPKDQQGTVSGLLNLSRNIGLITGASVMGIVFSYGVGTDDFAHASASAFAEGMQLTFLLASGMMICAIAMSLARSRQ